MKNIKVYFPKLFYSVYMGIFMGIIITSGFFVIITNIDRYFFNSILGIGGDWLYYAGSALLIPFFGSIYIYNKRIVINGNILEIREKGLSFSISDMDISEINSISLHKQRGRRRDKLGIKFEDGETVILVFIKLFSKITLSNLIKDLTIVNPDIIVDDYYLNYIKSN